LTSSRGSSKVFFRSLENNSRSSCKKVDLSWLRNSFSEPSASLFKCNSLSREKRPFEERGTSRTSRKNAGKEGDCESSSFRTPQSSLLFKHFSSSEMGRGLETNHKPFSAEFECRSPAFQNGNDTFCYEGSTSRRLGSFPRSVRRLLPHSNSSKILQVPKVCSFSNKSLPVCSTPFWPLYSPSCIHQSSRSSSFLHSESRSVSSCLSGRLVDSSSRAICTTPANSNDPRSTSRSRLDSKHEEIIPSTLSGIRISRSKVSNQGGSSTTSFSPYSKSITQDTRSSKPENSYTQASHGITGSLQFYGSNCKPRTITHETNPTFHVKVRPTSHELGSAISSIQRIDKTSSNMGESKLAVSGSSSPTTFTQPKTVYRQLSNRLGSTSRRQLNQWELDTEGISSSYKLARDESSFVSNKSLQTDFAQKDCSITNRQFISSSLPESPRRNKVDRVVQVDLGDFSFLPEKRNCSSSSPHSFEEKCISGFTLSQKTNSIGMVTESSGIQVSSNFVSNPINRLVCDTNEYTDSEIHFSVPRRPSNSSRRSVRTMELSSTDVCFPSSASHRSSTKENQKARSKSTPNSTLLAKAKLVHRSIRVDNMSHNRIAKNAKPSVTRSVNSSKPKSIPSSRLACIRSRYRKRGYSTACAEVMSKVLRQSTNELYDRRWKMYESWCLQRSLDPFKANGPQLARFLLYLFEVKKLKPVTIRGFRASIYTVLKAKAPLSRTLQDDLTTIMRAFYQKSPVVRQQLPKWDLGLVLHVFRSAPFEPLSKATLENLTYKCIFLVALASAQRCSELAALRRDPAHFKRSLDWTYVTLYPDPQFRAKTQSFSHLPQPIIIKSLSQVVSKDSSDYLNCPVRALRYYLDRTNSQEFLKDRVKLFLAMNSNKEITSRLIGIYIRKAVETAYKCSPDKDILKMFNVRPHSLRRLASSLAAFSNVALKDILHACNWRSQTVFTDYYLRSCASFADGKYELGHLAVAGALVNPGSGQGKS
jgi:integrase